MQKQVKVLPYMEPEKALDISRILLITGNYGSGKTELSLNLTLSFAKEEPVTLVDLDIINPYFRSAEHAGRLREAGARVLMPSFALTTVDIPALPAEIVTAFDQPEGRVFFDVGGDDTGATALGRYKPQIDRTQAKLIFVVNACRPLTRDADSIIDLIERVTAKARIPVSILVNNTNTGHDTTPDEIVRGGEITRQVMDRLEIGMAFHAADASLLDELPGDMRPFTLPILPMTRPEWM